MKYWLTTHWPPYEHESNSQSHVYLRDGHRGAVRGLHSGDRVLIFETQGGKTRSAPPAKRIKGRRGVVAVARVVTELEDTNSEPEHYKDDTFIWWKWRARTCTISQNGFVPWQRVNQVLGYPENYYMRGFGGRTGLKEIDEEQFNQLVELFHLGGSP